MSGKVSVGGDGSRQISFTSRSDIARYVSYVLTHLSPEQLKNRTFTIAGENKVMSLLRNFCYGLVVAFRLRTYPCIVVQRDLQGVRRKDWEEAAGDLRPRFRIRSQSSCQSGGFIRCPAQDLGKFCAIPAN